ncbi:MAG: lysophospholipid acyltransferase family protein [Chlamydia sp.]
MEVLFPCDEKQFFQNIKRPIIITPNHVSYLDPPIISAVWPTPLHFFASSHLFERARWFSWILKQLSCHPLKRGSGIAAIKEGIRLISEEGLSIVIFPEGTRSSTGMMQPLQEGAAFIAVKSQAMLIPAYISGAYQAWPRGRLFPRLFGKISIRFGEPIDPLIESEGKSVKELVFETHQKLEQSFKELLS